MAFYREQFKFIVKQKRRSLMGIGSVTRLH